MPPLMQQYYERGKNSDQIGHFLCKLKHFKLHSLQNDMTQYCTPGEIALSFFKAVGRKEHGMVHRLFKNSSLCLKSKLGV